MEKAEKISSLNGPRSSKFFQSARPPSTNFFQLIKPYSSRSYHGPHCSRRCWFFGCDIVNKCSDFEITLHKHNRRCLSFKLVFWFGTGKCLICSPQWRILRSRHSNFFKIIQQQDNLNYFSTNTFKIKGSFTLKGSWQE